MLSTSRVLMIVASLSLSLMADDESGSGRIRDQEALKPFGSLVGQWRGTGQPQRGAARGSWTESSEWSWGLTKESASLKIMFEKGKYLKSATLRPGPEPKSYHLDATLADGSSREFLGKLGAKGALILSAKPMPEDGLARITITPLHETRCLMLLESADNTGAFTRLGEVGYTRKGVAFAAADSAPTCIVTGGRGTIAVKHEGKTYYVCCSGCKDLFDEDPARVISEMIKKSSPK